MVEIKWPNRIKEVRESKRMTQRDLARAIDTSETYISRLENGKAEAGAMFLQRLAEALGVPIDDLFVKSKRSKR